MDADLREVFDRWAEGTRYTHEHFSRLSGKYVGRVPAEEFRAAEVALLEGVPALFDEIEALRALLAWQVEDQDGRYVVLCDDGSIIATDDRMDGDDVLLDREANGSTGAPAGEG